ncbi:MAG: hypothetical protein R2865_01960 [Deinococcales bacterium]
MRFLGLGGVDEVGGSSYLFNFADHYILVDAGLRPTMVGKVASPPQTARRLSPR